MPQFDNVSVITTANVYFDGKCVSHTVLFENGARKTVGVIFPSILTFKTGEKETVELQAGECKVKLAGAAEWQRFREGERFSVPANSSFEIETIETIDYVCHFG
ncbi:MAG: pyrimidine/purine nucleoside phosphorylase [Burkholderiales bacterium]|nr:pyrimidine/purine nucleoside phosphorylase [Burkholderiales bacterium]MDQ3195636.1 pyrimidine/purine nucleoside phosphorylase [Pseudomonadota bacterium]